MDKKILKFDLSSEDVKVRDMANKDFLKIHINAVSSALPNNNLCCFTKESQEISLPTWDNKPILGYFGKRPIAVLTGEGEDFFSHEGGEVAFDEELQNYYYDYSKDTDEKAIGLVVPGSAKLVYHEDDGLWWTECDAIIWCKYNYRAVKNILRSKKKTVSVEIEVLKSYEDENEYEIFEDFSLMGITILNDNVKPGISNAHLSVSAFSKTEKFQKQMKLLSFAYNDKKNLNQNKNNNNFSEEDVYHTNHPINPDNEDYKEIAFVDKPVLDDNSDDGINTFNSKGERKEKKFSMLTYNMKRQLLDSALSECIANNYGSERGYGWIQDFTDEECYFYLDCTGEEDGTYVAPYTITMTTENGEEKVDNCTIDFAQKERAVQTWRKMSEEDSKGTEKTDMNKNEFSNDVVQNPEKDGITVPEHFDDRGTEAPHSGDDRGKAAPKSGDDRGVPKTGTHENHAAEDQTDENKDSKEDAKENESCGDKKEEACNKETEAKEVTDVESKSAGGDKEVTEVKSKSTNAKEDNKDNKDDSKEDPEKKTEGCDCDDKETEACKGTEKECNYEAKFAQLSADYVTMQKENETLKAVNAKFEADIADLMAKVQSFEAETKVRHNNDMFAFASNMINAETDITEDCRKTMSEEVKAECEAGKFASEDEVKKFTVTKIAMALYEARQNGQNSNVNKDNVNKVNNEKKEFAQNIVKNTPSVDALTASRMALEKLGEED